MDSSLTLNKSLANGSGSVSCHAEPQHVSITVFISLVFLVGFFLNSFSLWVFCCNVPNWSSGTVLHFNLALSDAIGSPGTLIMAVNFALGHWPFGRFLCQIKIALLSTHFYGSTMFLTLISVHRYVAVVYFNKRSYMKQKGFVSKLCGGVWVMLLVKTAVYAVCLPPTKEDNTTQCHSIHQNNLTNIHFALNFLLFTFGFILPFSVSAICYSRLASVVSSININTGKGLAVKTKSLRMIGICLVIFGLCFLPLHVARTTAVVIKKYYSTECRTLLRVETGYYVCVILAGINCCLDPLLYVFGSHSFAKAFKNSLKISSKHKGEDKRESDGLGLSGTDAF
ncbi:P2Y purinoceptor 2 [Osmerus mordax]|uniref:P2Y purinoceptor 2 n=1 Tax=Osmerus mordax TaxID=8014 RepID=UPI003510716E